MESQAYLSGRGEIEEELERPALESEAVYVALGKEFKEGKATLLWTLQNFRRPIVIIHVHRPPKMIPICFTGIVLCVHYSFDTNIMGILINLVTVGAKFPASQLKEQEVIAFRQLDREKMNKSLDDYLLVCSELKIKAEKIVIEADAVAKGLIEFIAQQGITKFVMGAAADKHYSKNMKAPRSKTATTVRQQADPSCCIWFVCKGNFICTRKTDISSGLSDSPESIPSLVHSSTSIPIQSEQLAITSEGMGETSKFNAQRIKNFFRNSSSSTISGLHGGGTMLNLSILSSAKLLFHGSGHILKRSYSGNSLDKLSMRSLQTEYSSSCSGDEVLSTSDFQSLPKDEESSVFFPALHESDKDFNFSSPHNELEDVGVDLELYQKLQEALSEAEDLKHEVYKESLMRQRAERTVIEAIQRAKASENLYAEELNLRKKVDETLKRAKLEIEMLKKEQMELCEKLQKTNKHKLQLELHIGNLDNCVKDLEEKLLAALHLLHSVEVEHDVLQRERDEAIREAEELRRKKEEVPCSILANLSAFSLSEIEQATCTFDKSLKIGEGGSGTVYKGFLRNTTVAIKALNHDGMLGRSEFDQEVEILSRVRHPNLVSFIGACPEALTLVYEYLPNGNLEDRLSCKSNTTPLTWQARTRIAAEICTALMFLHSSKPHPVVHGDLKPENILLDANLVSKLSDFGLCNFVVQADTTTLYRHTHPKGTFAYMDPEFLATGDLTPLSDVYSFGVIILRLLTGMPALGLVKVVQEVMNKQALYGIIDPTSGDWPLVQAKQLAHLGLRCCQMNRKNRPDLVGEVWKVLEPMSKAASFSATQLSFSSITDDNCCIPSYFICPIFQEIMKNPHIAADGFTYDEEALRIWFNNGHNTSPMTNLKLPNSNLIPNRALRSAIQEWLQQQQKHL
ncbi:hypothetical protein IEQ34_001116 [Dendrobium chrysotoxum]|uniref:RING-type E3 ubiquitin transferase n=1 Tax=Dendrobium chrysotoxum TaxID=161865 RepID=A0AAV7HNC1_DENCH|nr:hypothetical protein IEQ34_001116 [Dendrobium chrysotoxum]